MGTSLVEEMLLKEDSPVKDVSKTSSVAVEVKLDSTAASDEKVVVGSTAVSMAISLTVSVAST